MNPVCILRSVWWSLRAGAFVSGHEFRTSKDKTPPNIHILECETCGATSLTWSWHSLEGNK